MANDDEPKQSGENKTGTKIDDDELLVAGRKPAGKLDIFHGYRYRIRKCLLIY